jgi:hypothetical protein
MYMLEVPSGDVPSQLERLTMNVWTILSLFGAAVAVIMATLSYAMLRRSRIVWVIMDNDYPAVVFASERKARTYCKTHERQEEDAPHHYVRAYPFTIVL